MRWLLLLMSAALVVAASAGAHAQPAQPPVTAASPTISLSLDQALNLGLTNNLQYQAAAADVRAAAARLVQTDPHHLPALSADYKYTHNQNAGFFAFPVPSPSPHVQQILVSATDVNSINATLEYALYDAGIIEAASGESAAGLSAAESQYAAARANMVRDLTTGYFQLVSAKQLAAIAGLATSVAKDNLDVANKLFSAGTKARADVLRADVTYENARVQAIQADNTAALANANLANLLNVNLSSQITPTEPLAITAPAYSLDDMLNDAHTKRPEVAAAHDAVLIAQNAIKLARSGALPLVTIQVQEASTKPNFVNVPQPQLSETLEVAWKLFDGGMTRGKVQEAVADLDKANIQLKQLDNGVDLEVRQAWLNYRAASAQLDAAKTAAASAAESLRVSEIRFRAGVGTSLELSDAELADTQARSQVVAALVNLRTTLVALQRAAGLL